MYLFLFISNYYLITDVNFEEIPKNYAESEIIAAVAAVKNGMSFHKASAKYNVPTSTVRDRFYGPVLVAQQLTNFLLLFLFAISCCYMFYFYKTNKNVMLTNFLLRY